VEMAVPEDLRYSADHEWVRLEGNNARIGITHYAQDALGDVVYVQLPSVGADVKAADSFGEVESTKSVSDLFAPVGGRVIAINDALADSPQLVNDDPYGDGWLCVIEMSDASEFQGLMTPDGYRELLDG
jgi:glycine cleavage system H protein